jgi:hypothetical protein
MAVIVPIFTNELLKTAILGFIVCGISNSLVERNAVCREKILYAFGEVKCDSRGAEFHETRI